MTNKITVGSLSDVAKQGNKGLAQSFLNADTVLLLDCSGSMEVHDAPGGLSRKDAAREQLVRLQETYQGRFALVCFADYPIFAPQGIQINCGSSTDMAAGLKYILPVDGTGTRLILISDGMPNNPSGTLEVARQFETAIQTLYIGPEEDLQGGRAFLEKLAALTGGQSLKSDAPGLLGDGVEKLLLETG